MLRLISDLLAATGDAHSPRALVRAVAITLARHLPITRVELLGVIAEFVDGSWRIVEGPSCQRELAPGLAVTGEVALDADAREALGHVIAAATRHLDVVQRVAKLSRRAHAENRELRQRLERNNVVAHSVAMRSALTRVQLVARHPTAVLLLGESGSGKEVLAREIHRLSPRGHRQI